MEGPAQGPEPLPLTLTLPHTHWGRSFAAALEDRDPWTLSHTQHTYAHTRTHLNTQVGRALATALEDNSLICLQELHLQVGVGVIAHVLLLSDFGDA